VKIWIFDSLVFLLPVLGIQFLFGNASFQYGAPIASMLVAIIVFSDHGWRSDFSKWAIVLKRLAVIMMIYAGADYILKATKIFGAGRNSCKYDQQKVTEFEKVRTYIVSHQEGNKVLTTGGLVPVVIAPNQQLFQYNIFSKPQEEYQIIAIGKPGSSDLYGLGPEKAEQVIQACRPHASEVIFDTKNVFLAKGHFTEECLHQYHPF
jgi:hypothetical protein